MSASSDAPAAAPRTFTAGIAGASGYTGLELQRILAGHPALAAAVLQARSDGFEDLSADGLAACDVVFLALPHGQSRPFGEELARRGVRVVDLGSDFRIAEWTYGLPELRREVIAGSRAVANPGCYATAAILGLAPLAAAGLLDGPVMIDGKSGVSGAGKQPGDTTHFANVDGGVQPYSPTGHRHVAEIEQELAALAGAKRPVTFTPHLVPASRGLIITAYARLREPLSQAALDRLYVERYAGEPFVRLGDSPAPQRLNGSNVCHIAAWADERTQTAIVASAIDNLVKGAAGQAVQNANLMLGLDEGLGLTTWGLWP